MKIAIQSAVVSRTGRAPCSRWSPAPFSSRNWSDASSARPKSQFVFRFQYRDAQTGAGTPACPTRYAWTPRRPSVLAIATSPVPPRPATRTGTLASIFIACLVPLRGGVPLDEFLQRGDPVILGNRQALRIGALQPPA